MYKRQLRHKFHSEFYDDDEIFEETLAIDCRSKGLILGRRIYGCEWKGNGDYKDRIYRVRSTEEEQPCPITR